MSLREKQSKFVLMLGQLISYADANGYELTLGRGRVSEAANKADGGHERSLHLSGLAQDLNIFKDGAWLTDGTGHDELHDFWDSIGGAERIPNDLNHYSLEWRGMR